MYVITSVLYLLNHLPIVPLLSQYFSVISLFFVQVITLLTIDFLKCIEYDQSLNPLQHDLHSYLCLPFSIPFINVFLLRQSIQGGVSVLGFSCSVVALLQLLHLNLLLPLLIQFFHSLVQPHRLQLTIIYTSN